MTEPSIVQVEAAKTFTRDLRTLAKKYRSIYQDVQPIIEELQNGNVVGDQIANIGMRSLRSEFATRIFRKAKAVDIASFTICKPQLGSFS
ncbi:hypothetical protein [Leptolyngbya sp. AN10]|uniref:hypothetical protein n=1 Tax=Leptolyngbya sp. AN10 TaxID=3423365 RepID=UPI003D31CBFE